MTTPDNSALTLAFKRVRPQLYKNGSSCIITFDNNCTYYWFYKHTISLAETAPYVIRSRKYTITSCLTKSNCICCADYDAHYCVKPLIGAFIACFAEFMICDSCCVKYNAMVECAEIADDSALWNNHTILVYEQGTIDKWGANIIKNNNIFIPQMSDNVTEIVDRCRQNHRLYCAHVLTGVLPSELITIILVIMRSHP